MDARRRRRGLWAVLSEAYAPVVIDSVGLSTVHEGIQQAEIALRARGPVHIDMPAYTLRGYGLQWQVVRVENPVLLAHSDLPCPILAPAASWSVRIAWPMPAGDYILLRIIRPTRFTVVERSYQRRSSGVRFGSR
jgi:hypothetical protein